MKAYDVLAALDKASQAIRKDEEQIYSAIKTTSQTIARLQQEQSEQYKNLAKIRFDDITRSPVIGEMSELEKRTQKKYTQFKKEADRIEDKKQNLENNLAQAEEEQNTVLQKLEQAQKDRHIQKERTRDRLNRDTVWQNRITAFKAFAKKVEASEQKLKASEQDRDKKSKSYLDDRLFAYLHNLKFGTPDYKGGYLTRWGDGYVARIIGYDEARQNFFMLNEIPLRLKKHVENMRKKLESLQDEMQAAFQQELEHDGIAPFDQQIQDLTNSQTDCTNTIKSLENSLKETEAEYLDLLDGNHQQGMNAILADLIASLKRTDIHNLMQDALATPTPDDEKIVTAITQQETGIDAAQKQLLKLRTQLNDTTRIKAEINRSREDFQNAGYTYQDTLFDNDREILMIINAILTGTMTSRSLRDSLHDNHRIIIPHKKNDNNHDDWFGGGWGGGGRSGGFGGGGFRSGGGFGGGGFRSGGGF